MKMNIYIICTDDADEQDPYRRESVLSAHKNKEDAETRITELYSDLVKEYGREYETRLWITASSFN